MLRAALAGWRCRGGWGSAQGVCWGSSRGLPGDLEAGQQLQGLALLSDAPSAPKLLRGSAGLLAGSQAAWPRATPCPARGDAGLQARSSAQVPGALSPAGGAYACSEHARSASTRAPAAGTPATGEAWLGGGGSRSLRAALDRAGEGSEGQAPQAAWWPGEAGSPALNAAQVAGTAGVSRSAAGEQGTGVAGGRALSAVSAEISGSGARTGLEQWWSGETASNAGSAVHSTGRASSAGSSGAGGAAAALGRPDPGSAGFGGGGGHGGITDILGFGEDSDEDAAAWSSGDGAGTSGRGLGEGQEAEHSGRLKGEAALDALKSALAAECASEVRRLGNLALGAAYAGST